MMKRKQNTHTPDIMEKKNRQDRNFALENTLCLLLAIAHPTNGSLREWRGTFLASPLGWHCRLIASD